MTTAQDGASVSAETLSRDGRPLRRWVLWAVAGIATFLLVLPATTRLGISWDESEYIHAGTSYTYWFTSAAHPFSASSIERFWTWQHYHPPLAQLMIGLATRLFQPWLGVLTAARLAPALCFALAVVLLGVWCERRLGLRSAVLAAVSLVMFPRVFGAAHFAALDVPMMLLWLASAAALETALRHTRAERPWFREAVNPWSLLTGVVFGLALLTKLNALFLPVVLWPWALVRFGRRALGPVVACCVLGPPAFFLGWPWLYHETATRAALYITDKLGGRPLPLLYLGRLYLNGHAPWHYPLVMLAATVPLGLLVAAGVASAAAVRRRSSAPVVELALVNVVGVLVVAALPWAPKYDGIRLFLPAFPFLAILSGVGLERMYGWLRRLLPRRERLAAALGIAFVALQGWGLIWAWPFHLAWYNIATGGTWGAQRIGFETLYWGESFDRPAWSALEELLSRRRKGDPKPRVAFAGVSVKGVEFLQRCGYLSDRFQAVGDRASDAELTVVSPREGWILAEGRAELLSPATIKAAAFVQRHHGRPVCWIVAGGSLHR